MKCGPISTVLQIRHIARTTFEFFTAPMASME
jgi:hypothetical protein